MGYDMYWVEDERDDNAYFRLNIFGMQEAREAMEKLGMVHWNGEPDFNQPNVTEAAVEYPGIPGWKLCSNDGWLVNPIEIESAMQLYEKNKPECFVPDGWFKNWLDWLGAAAEHGGFRVY